ncbi:DUF4349 domain-containing protein [Flavobacteriaceae bacterium XHP0103]|uniref:DUF4349 domain-containing protein n=1 Tax=Marixanthotalea marina TaxID=2844359 RepID=UPI002989CB7C|nr:DUF4349 domain-containing protein [Marixanthotalea marina]MBU3820599.1 DUF4349 domain-containing protein [Marixanthotalea marina]
MKSLIALFLLVLPLACSQSSSDNETVEHLYLEEEMAIEPNASSLKRVVMDDGVSVGNALEDVDQKIIKESYLRFQTQDLEKTYNQIKQIVLQNKGFIQSDNTNKSYNTTTRHLTIRIPTSAFQNTLDSISKHVSYFDSKNISARDVTEEFIDLEARLKAKQTLEKRYLELLNKANNVKDILEIERELSAIREEIEAKQGRLKYLEDRVSLSTINIEFYKQSAETGITVSYGSKMWNAIKSGFDALSSFFLGVLYIWPFIIILIIIFFVLKKWINKSTKK